jgi:hypothetical protein
VRLRASAGGLMFQLNWRGACPPPHFCSGMLRPGYRTARSIVPGLMVAALAQLLHCADESVACLMSHCFARFVPDGVTAPERVPHCRLSTRPRVIQLVFSLR